MIIPMTDDERRLTEEYLYLVPEMVKKLTSRCAYVSYDEQQDLLQAGNLALCKAAMNYDNTRPFAVYAKVAMGYTLSKLYDVELLHRQALKLRTYIEDALYPYIALQDCLVVDMERIEDTPIIYNTITQKVYENGQWSKQDLDLHGKLLIYVKSSPPMPAATEQINNGF